MTTTSMTTPAGWYDDGSGRQRYWDGAQWTEHFAPIASPVQVVTNTPVVVERGKVYKTSHGFHLIMSLITLGMWIPVWIVVGIYNAAKN